MSFVTEGNRIKGHYYKLLQSGVSWELVASYNWKHVALFSIKTTEHSSRRMLPLA